MTGLCLYAVVREAPGEPGDWGAGPGGGPLRAVAAGGLVAVVAERDAPPGLSVPALEDHDATVRRLAERVPALLPARFGGWLPDERALAGWMAERRRSFEQALTLVEGCVQMTLRVFGAAGVPGAEEPVETPVTQQPLLLSEQPTGPGASYLAGRLAAHRRTGSLPEAAGLLDTLRPLVRAERIRRHDAGPLVATAHHLIARGDLEAYREAVAVTAGTSGPYRLTASGPWPPYAFTEEEPS